MAKKIIRFFLITELLVFIVQPHITYAEAEMTSSEIVDHLYESEENEGIRNCAKDFVQIMTGEKIYELYQDSWGYVGTYPIIDHGGLIASTALLGKYDPAVLKKTNTTTLFLQSGDFPHKENIILSKSDLLNLYYTVEELKAATAELYAVEKVNFIHDFICKELIYISGTADHAATCLRTGTADCGGYAGLFYLIGQNCGLQVNCKSGTYGSYRHIWNEVLIDHEWLVVDLATDDINQSRVCCLITKAEYSTLGVMEE